MQRGLVVALDEQVWSAEDAGERGQALDGRGQLRQREAGGVGRGAWWSVAILCLTREWRHLSEQRNPTTRHLSS